MFFELSVLYFLGYFFSGVWANPKQKAELLLLARSLPIWQRNKRGTLELYDKELGLLISSQEFQRPSNNSGAIGTKGPLWCYAEQQPTVASNSCHRQCPTPQDLGPLYSSGKAVYFTGHVPSSRAATCRDSRTTPSLVFSDTV